MADELETELKTYEEERQDLLRLAENKFVLIRKTSVIDTFDTENDAIKQGYKDFGNVPFLVKRIVRVERPETFVSNLIAL